MAGEGIPEDDVLLLHLSGDFAGLRVIISGFDIGRGKGFTVLVGFKIFMVDPSFPVIKVAVTSVFFSGEGSHSDSPTSSPSSISSSLHGFSSDFFTTEKITVFSSL